TKSRQEGGCGAGKVHPVRSPSCDSTLAPVAGISSANGTDLAGRVNMNRAVGVAHDLFATPRDIPSADDCVFYHEMDIPDHGRVVGEGTLTRDPPAYLGYTDLRHQRALEVGPKRRRVPSRAGGSASNPSRCTLRRTYTAGSATIEQLSPL